MRTLRCLTFNLWGGEPPLDRRMALTMEGIRALRPDVVALQEVQDRPDLPNQAEGLAKSLGLTPVFAPAVAFRGGHEGLAILSRYPVVEHARTPLPHATNDEARVLLSVGIDAGGERPTWVHTTHLNYRLHHGREREDQVMAIADVVASRPDCIPQIILGDFNARPESDEIRWLCGLTTLGGRRVFFQDAWASVHPGELGWTWASSNRQTEPLAFLQPNRRLDYIFVTAARRDGRGRIHDCRLALDKPDASGLFASDHFGVLAEIQLDPDGATDPRVV
ncbi:MAG TPA: endonuclease/exonuclease/phosphatase family protein [Polyangia bacterium]